MQFVVDDVKKNNRVGKAVMNMSLGGDKSEAINRAIEALFKAGVVPVVAAGNENVS
jgi:subtilisin family serine protease